MKRHDQRVRKALYRIAEFIEVPPQTVLFEMGDMPDYMYIILKGRVVISTRHFHYKDITRILTTLLDGEEFGSVNTVDSSEAEAGSDLGFNQREVTAKTVEKSRMLRVAVYEANAIIKSLNVVEGSTPQPDRLSRTDL